MAGELRGIIPAMITSCEASGWLEGGAVGDQVRWLLQAAVRRLTIRSSTDEGRMLHGDELHCLVGMGAGGKDGSRAGERRDQRPQQARCMRRGVAVGDLAGSALTAGAAAG